MNPDLLRSTWAVADSCGDRFFVDFYSRLFLDCPDAQALFPQHMAAQRVHVARALTEVVAAVDNLDAAVPMLQELGRRHVTYGATARHYAAVGRALIDTFDEHLGEHWTQEAADTWTVAYTIVAKVMTDAATEAPIEPVDQGDRHGR